MSEEKINTDHIENEIKDADDLTPKEAKFVLEYLIDNNGTQSVIRSGFTDNPNSAGVYANRLLRKAKIIKAIEEQMRYRAERTLITADYILTSMKEVAERCLQKKPVMIFDYEEKKMVQEKESYLDEQGKLVEEGVWEFDSAGANKALENLARNQKLLTDKTEVGNLDGTNFEAPVIKRIYVKSTEEADQELKVNGDGNA